MAKFVNIDGLKPIKVFLSAYAEEPILVYKKDDIDRRTAADVAPVVWCKDCKLHGNCITEDSFVFSGIKADNAFCCVGKRKGKQDE